MDEDALMALAAVGQDEAQRLSRQLGKPIDVGLSALITLARIAIHMADGEGYIKEHVRLLVEDMVRRMPDAPAYKYEYEPADADERRQAGTFYHGMSPL